MRLWVEVAVNRSRSSAVGFLSLAVASLLGCGIDDRDPPTANIGSPEAGVTGQGGGASLRDAGVVGRGGGGSSLPETGGAGPGAGGSGNELTCSDGACGCPLLVDGSAQLDCGGGVCVPDGEGACCPGSAPEGCHCDLADNLCKECLQNEHCTNGPGGSLGQCNVDRTCSYPCEPGFKSCGVACIANAECCGGCAEAEQCQSGQCRINDGATCSAGGTVCSSSNCSAGRCCPLSCGGGGCNAEGSCECPNAEQFARGACRRVDGQTCTANEDCVNGCTDWFEDADGDGFGNPEGTFRRVCGPQAPALGVVSNGDDCCDVDARIKPGQAESFRDFIRECPASWKFHDFDCSNTVEYIGGVGATGWGGACDDIFETTNDLSTPCEERSGIFLGPNNPFGLGEDALLTGEDAALCGNSSIEWKICRTVEGTCQNVQYDLAPPCR